MADEIELVVDTRELEAALRAVPDKLRGEAMRKALQAGGNVLLDAVFAHTPERTDEETPGSTALPPGVMKADMHTQIQMGSASQPPRIKVGPSSVTGHVARWQNDGYTLTKGHRESEKRKNASRRQIKSIPGKHFIEAAFDESAQTAVDMFLAVLGDNLLGTGAEDEGVGPDRNYGGGTTDAD
jgi:hypothetical protein